MFRVEIFNTDNEQLFGEITPGAGRKSAYPFSNLLVIADHVAGLVDRLNNPKKYKSSSRESSVFGSKSAADTNPITQLMENLNTEPSFRKSKLLDKKNINYTTYAAIYKLTEKTYLETSELMQFFDLLSQLNLQGQGSIKCGTGLTKNHELLFRSDFPDELIPEHYLCNLTAQVMDAACHEDKIPDTIVDKEKFLKALTGEAKNLSPYTKRSITELDILMSDADKNLQTKIDFFIQKVLKIKMIFPSLQRNGYEKYLRDLTDHTFSLEDLTRRLEVEKNAMQLKKGFLLNAKSTSPVNDPPVCAAENTRSNESVLAKRFLTISKKLSPGLESHELHAVMGALFSANDIIDEINKIRADTRANQKDTQTTNETSRTGSTIARGFFAHTNNNVNANPVKPTTSETANNETASPLTRGFLDKKSSQQTNSLNTKQVTESTIKKGFFN